MKAVNLIPRDQRGAARTVKVGSLSPTHALLVLLAVAVAYVTMYVLTDNTISSRKAQLSTLHTEITRAQAQAATLKDYVSYQQLAEQRAQTVREIVTSRFNWDAALTELSKVVPANTSLQSLLGTVVPGASVQGSGGGANTGGLRTDIVAPAFEIHGCSASQDDVAGLMSRLRLINGVTRVTLSDSQRGSGTTTGGTGDSCRPGAASFDLVVFFTAVPNAGADGLTTSTSGTAGTTATTTTTSATATTTTKSSSTTSNGG